MARFLNTCFWNFSLSTKKWARGIPQYIFFFFSWNFLKLTNAHIYIFLEFSHYLFSVTFMVHNHLLYYFIHEHLVSSTNLYLL